MSICLAAPIFH
jgi:hypothetical protein